jgi:uncharacterized membrane protein
MARKAKHDAQHRAQGVAAEMKGKIAGEEQVSDTQVFDRVRSRLGRIVSHPGAVHVEVMDGTVKLSGPILSHEARRVLRRIKHIGGVREVVDELERHDTSENVPALQGGKPREERSSFMQEVWSPVYRVVGAAAGVVMVGAGLRFRGLLGGLFAGLGGGLLLRAATNLPLRRLTGIGAGSHAIDLMKHIHIDAPPKQLFEFFRSPENFPRFMSHLRSVEWRDDHWHWVAAGPAGVPVSFDAIVTSLKPDELIAWESLPGSSVETSGQVRLEPTPDGRTRIEVRLSYNPPAGAIGHAFASLFGADPKKALDDDLLRLKSLLEVGRATAHGHTVTKQEVLSDLANRQNGPGNLPS